MKSVVQLNLRVRIKGLSEFVSDENEFHETSLTIAEDKIILAVRFPNLDIINYKMGTWNNEVDFDTWGKYVICEDNKAYRNEDEFVDIDFSESKLLTYSGSSHSPYISFLINKVQYSYNIESEENGAVFWLNKAGHTFVQDYYNIAWGKALPERKNILPHDVLESQFLPLFEFINSDNKNEQEIKIRKVPIVKWRKLSTWHSVIQYNTWICQLASIYYGNNINYTHARIDIDGRRTIIYQMLSDSNLKPQNTFLFFNGLQQIYKFLDTVSYSQIKIYSKQFTTISERFIQSRYLDGSTRYLVLYNILELCQNVYGKKKKNKSNNKAVKTVITGKTELLRNHFTTKFNQIIEDIEDPIVKQSIKARYNAACSALNREPSGKTMLKFIEEQGFDIDRIREYTNEDIFKLRNQIMHGSSMGISDTINDILSFIGKVLILRVLECPIQIHPVLGYSDIYKL